jgi:rod shape-determining protein MreB
MLLPKVTGAFSDDIAIDLGTANTLVYVSGKGIVIDEPSMVAVRAGRGAREMVAVGEEALRLVGRTPEPLEHVRPMRDGVIADFVATEFMLRQFIRRARSMLGFRRPRILISVPAGATPVERRAVTETARYAGARRIELISEPVAALLGAGIALDDGLGAMVVDIGGGTTDVAVLSEGEVLLARSLRCAGHAMDEAIIRYVRRRHHLVIGWANAERIKIEAGTAVSLANGRYVDVHITGRELRRGRLKSVVLQPRHVAEALDEVIEEIAEFARRTLEDVPAKVAAEICERGIHLTGGGALLERLEDELGRRVGAPFLVAPHPMQCVIKGTALVLEHLKDHDHLLIPGDL